MKERTKLRSALSVLAVIMVGGCTEGMCTDRACLDAGPSTTDAAVDGGVEPCEADRDCSDSLYCNGIERCRPGSAGADARGCEVGEPPCDVSGVTCVEAAARCVTDCGTSADADGDGWDSIDCGGTDCDDSRGDVHPGTSEVCDADGVDEDCVPETLGPDEDGDGFSPDRCCYQPPGAGAPLVCGRDCRDDSSDVSPSAPETCNDLDDDCDGAVDERVRETYYQDTDGDLYGDTLVTMTACVRPSGFVAAPGDCDDSRADINPGRDEACDGEDRDCDGNVDESGDLGTLDNCLACGDVCQFQCGTTGCDGPTSITTGWNHSCAMLDSGRVLCWGAGGDGQLGNSVAADSDVPSWVAGVSDADLLVAGAHHTCLRRSSMGGGIFCFGRNTHGQLGDGSRTNRSTPVRADDTFLDYGSDVAVGRRHTCAVYSGRVVCWGDNNEGQLGTGSQIDQLRPVTEVSGIPAAAVTTQVAAGFEHSCALTSAGELYCWGSNLCGAMAMPTMFPRQTSARRISFPGATVLDVEISSGTTCALLSDGTVRCWGANYRGQLGDGMRSHGRTCDVGLDMSFAPVTVIGVSSAVRFEHVAGFHFCARTSSGDTYCWGRNTASHQLGVSDSVCGDPDGCATPVLNVLASGASAVVGGSEHACILSGGAVSCWGSNDAGQLGNGGAGMGWTVPQRVAPPAP